MSSAARSGNATAAIPNPAPIAEREHLSGPVSICIDRPLLALDRPFTYDLPEALGAGVGSLVQVPFHGRQIRAWVLGPTEDVPERMLAVRKLVSRIRSFDERSLALYRRMSERYVADRSRLREKPVPAVGRFGQDYAAAQRCVRASPDSGVARTYRCR